MSSNEGLGQTLQQSAEDYWLQCIQTWYPELLSRTYFLPPLHFNRVPYSMEDIAGQQVLVAQTPQEGPSQTPSTPKSKSRKKKKKKGQNTFASTLLQPVQDSDLRDDKASQCVLHCLRALADNSQEVMMVISQLQFGKYLGEPSYAATAALLPRPTSLPVHLLQQHYDQGDFDVLIIHRQHGLFTLEVKSVGDNFSQLKMSEQQEDDVVMKKIKEALKQLSKSEAVLKHLTSDLIASNITKILVMPNINSGQLLRAVNRNPSDREVLCQCRGVQNVDDAVKLCLLSDQLSDQHLSSDGNHNSSQALREWWQHVVKASGPEQLMTSSLYEQLVARFCGPATTVEVHRVTAPYLNIRTLGEAVSETGERVTRLVLFPQQVDILNRSSPGAFLSGPPGTGKTIVLIMQGLTWLQRGHDVHVVSTWDESRAATIIIEHQLREITKTSTAKPHVHRHQFDFKKDGEVKTADRRRFDFEKYEEVEVETAVIRQFDFEKDEEVEVETTGIRQFDFEKDEEVEVETAVIHQFDFEKDEEVVSTLERKIRSMSDFWKDGEVKTAVRRLKSLSEGRQLCVIADEVMYDYPRKLFTKFCDQLIVQVPGVFIWGASMFREVRPLCLEEVKLTTPLRSPPVVVREVMESRRIKNKEVHYYTVSDVPVPTDGPPVMRIEHRGGQSGHTGRRPLDCVECGHEVACVLTKLDVGRTGNSNDPPPLQYRDVLVLCDGYPTDDRVKGFDLKTTTVSGLVRGLRDIHVPVRVVEEGDEAAVHDTALGVGDLVTVANWRDVQGLERKVVVVLTGIGGFDWFDRLHVISRCTSQLVVIDR